MSTVQERLQIKREPLDKWSVREQLSLASAVARSGDQNWMSVSRALKPFGDPNRPPDWFHQKNCASQYGSLLEHVETPKRKKRSSGTDSGVETPGESILRKLTRERLDELDNLLAADRTEYLKLQEDMVLLQSGNVSEEQLDQWCKEIDEEEKEKEEEAMTHIQWLKERELRKQEIERAWRPFIKAPPNVVIGQKRKASDGGELMDIDVSQEGTSLPLQTQDVGKPALSPLLTSLLKSPSQVPNVVTSSILHSAITNQRATNTTSNSTIASLLNTSPNITVSPSLQQLVSSAIGQSPTITVATSTPLSSTAGILTGGIDILPNLKSEDIESTILSSEDPLPEMKNEEVEVIISDLIQNADIVTDPEEHLQLDGNEDIISNLDNELQELCDEEEAAEAKLSQQEIFTEKEISDVDPFEFQEDPEFSQPSKSNIPKQQDNIKEEVASPEESTVDSNVLLLEEKDIKQEILQDGKSNEIIPGSVEIVEVVVMEDDEIEKQLNKSQIQDIVHSTVAQNIATESNESSELKVPDSKIENSDELEFDEALESIDLEIKTEIDANKEVTIDIVGNETSRRNTFTPEFTETFFDDMAMEVTKMDKTGKAKRDYSRTKKKEEKDFDILLAVEKAVNAQLEESELTEENLSDKDYHDVDKKCDVKLKLKSETDRSNSPWTEEDEILSVRTRRRYSTPATPIDSIPNSPASGIINFDEDRDYRNWKKSVMLVYNRLASHKFASLFLKPITEDQAPGYHSIVYRPMDLQTLRKNIENGAVRTTTEFQRDVLLMFNNAVMYNKTNELVYNMARQMQQESIQQIQLFLQAQAQDDTPVRRETRTSEPGNKRKRGPDENIRSKKRKED